MGAQPVSNKDFFKCSSHIFIQDREGSIAIGKDADFAVLDKNFNVYMTIRGGEIIHQA